MTSLDYWQVTIAGIVQIHSLNSQLYKSFFQENFLSKFRCIFNYDINLINQNLNEIYPKN